MGHAAGTEAFEVRRGGDKGRARAQMGGNSGTKWGGTETSGYRYYF